MTIERQILPEFFMENRKWISLGVFSFVLILLMIIAPNIGVTWDEPAYIAAQESYMGWFKELFTHPETAFSQETIDTFWSANHEHPPMVKLWDGFFWVISKGIFSDILAHRLGNLVLVALIAAMLYKMVADVCGDFAGLGAVLALLLMPRFLFHSNLCALDIPAAFIVLWVTFLFWNRVEKTGAKPLLLLILVSAVSIATKVNAFFIFPALLLWVLIFNRSWNLIIRLFVMGMAGLVLSFAFWPWVYHETLARIVDYVLFITVNHWAIGVHYLGRFYMPPPFHYAFVVAYAVIPFFTLVLAVLGAIRSTNKKNGTPAFGWLLIISAVFPLLALSTGQSMVYDGERLFMPAFPFIAALAGIGLKNLVIWVTDFVQKKSWKIKQPLVVSVVVVLAFILPFVSILQLYPHLLSFYSLGVGGLRGADKLGLEATYWCETYGEAIDFINQIADENDTVWVEPYSSDVLIYYQRSGRMREDLNIRYASQWESSAFGDIRAFAGLGSFVRSDYVIFQNRPTQFGGELRDAGYIEWLNGREPIYEINYQGVPIMQVFENPLK
ncbi:MAG: glycosyltransferase family 39 protein [Anaerolineales bacterium]|nr:glycosyltransferase family 39 protein [Anaerolineales bacterium]